MDGEEGGTEHFFDAEHMAEVTTGEVWPRSSRRRLRRGGIVGGFGVAEAEGSVVGEGQAIAAVAGGEDAVEHVDAAFDGFEDVFGVADAHEVARLGIGEQGGCVRDGVDHAFMAFADRKSAEGVAGEVEVGKRAGGEGAGFEVGAALDDAEEELGGRKRI